MTSFISEFEIIERFCKTLPNARKDIKLGIGDDAAIVKVPADKNLVITMDTLIAGVHFPLDTAPADIAYKALAVNLSDLAAMGAEPAWFTLSLTLPQSDPIWLTGFCQGLAELINGYQLALIGGDICRGHLSISIVAHGFLPADKGLHRSKAKLGDLIYVTGKIGSAAFALDILSHRYTVTEPLRKMMLRTLNRPEPQLAVGAALLNLAHAAIDISDGLAGDLTHILHASKVGAKVIIDSLPIEQTLLDYVSFDQAMTYALSGGDDYQLCFTIAKVHRFLMEEALASLNCEVTCIGEIVSEPGLQLLCSDGSPYQITSHSYRHF